jgi:hypothetical protein
MPESGGAAAAPAQQSDRSYELPDVIVLPDGAEALGGLAQGSDDLTPCYAPYYLGLLTRYLDLEPTVLGVVQRGRVQAACPLFVREGPAGRVANSLPYYGSHGGVLTDPAMSLDDRRAFKRSVLEGVLKWALSENLTLLTIINQPFEKDVDLYRDVLKPDFQDERIGQLLRLPAADDADQALDILMQGVHQKTRNLIRKGLRSTEVRESDIPEAFDFLHEVHSENMAAIGGLAKERRFFDLVQKSLRAGREYRLWVGSVDGERAAACLAFYYTGVIDYFTPVVKEQHRSTQALSAVIIRAIQSGAVAGFRWWNWGGTWLTQDGVYRFKSRWGGSDHRYFYHIKAFGNLDAVYELGPAGLLKSYPYFYTVPFRILQEKT